MIMIGHDQIAIRFDLMNFQCFMRDFLEGREVRLFVEDRRSKIDTV